MSTEVKNRRGTSTEHSTFIGANAEITVDTTNQELRLHDGVTLGGKRVTPIGTEFDQIPFNADIVYPVKSVQNIAGLIGTQDDQQISLKGWHVDSGVGGGTLYWDAAKLKSEHNGGTVFSPTVPYSAIIGDYLEGAGETSPSGSGCWVRRANINWFIDADWFGYIGDNTDETAVLQRICGVLSDKKIYIQKRVAVGMQPKLNIRKGSFYLSDTVKIRGFLLDIDFNGSLITATDGAVFSETWGIRVTDSYQVQIRNAVLVGFSHAIDLDNNNIDTGQILVDNVQMVDCKNVYRVDARSSNITFNNFRFVQCSYILDLVAGDKVNFTDGWLYPDLLDNDNDAYFTMRSGSNTPNLTLDKVFYGPFVQTVNGATVIKVEQGGAGFINVKNGLFGGELGQIPLVGWYDLSDVAPTRPAGISVKDTQYWCVDRAWIELHAFPASIVIDSCYGGTDNIDAHGLIEFVEDVRTIQQQQAVSDNMIIEIKGPTPQYSAVGLTRNAFGGTSGAILSRVQEAKLFKYVTSETRVHRYAGGVRNTAGTGLLLDIPASDRYFFTWYRVSLFMRTATSVDACAEYFVSYDVNGLADGIFPIKTGSGTNYPLVIKSSDKFYATGFIDAGSDVTIRVHMQKLSDVVNTRVGL